MHVSVRQIVYTYTSLVPSPTPIVYSMEKRGWPGTFPHMSDVQDRKMVERPKMNVGVRGSQNSKKSEGTR